MYFRFSFYSIVLVLEFINKGVCMKKVFLILILTCFVFNYSLAAEPILQVNSNYNPIKKYYHFAGDRYKFLPPSKETYKAYSKEERSFYKKNILKNQKLLVKANQSKLYKDKRHYLLKIIKDNKFYSPALSALLELYLENKDYSNAILIAEQLLKDDNDMSKTLLKQILADTTYLKGDYIDALPLLLEIDSIDKENQFGYYKYEIAVSYFNLNDITNTIKYLKLIGKNDKEYALAQDFLYLIYFNQKNYNEALSYAKELSRIYPNDAKQYMRIAACSNNMDLKLDNYYKARWVYISNNKTKEVISVDSLIANLEQAKIDNAVKYLKLFVEKPDWRKIIDFNSLYSDADYWSSRQYSFFKETNNCIANYNGKELCKCFETVNQEQNRLSLQRQKDLELRQQEKALKAQQDYQERQIKLQKLQYLQNQRAINNQYWQNQQMINSINRPKYYNITPTGSGGYYINQY